MSCICLCVCVLQRCYYFISESNKMNNKLYMYKYKTIFGQIYIMNIK